MSPRLNISLQGRFGNCCFQYAFAKAYSERHGMQLCCGPWVGEQIFQLDHAPAVEGLVRLGETEVVQFSIPPSPRKCDRADLELRGYFQQQAALIYTKRDCQRWFQFRPEVKAALDATLPRRSYYSAHIRRGDFAGYGYPLVSVSSYLKAARNAGYDPNHLDLVSDDTADFRQWSNFQGELSFLPDFYRLMNASALFRANSSFSWWASTLGNAPTFAPIIDGLKGGEEHDCEFVEGNWPRLASFDFTTDLRLQL